jgi:hypothetical protein
LDVNFSKTVAALVLGSALLVSPAQAALKLDQANIPETGQVFIKSAVGTALSEAYVLGHTFTAGLSGDLMRVDLAVFGSNFDATPGGELARRMATRRHRHGPASPCAAEANGSSAA